MSILVHLGVLAMSDISSSEPEEVPCEECGFKAIPSEQFLFIRNQHFDDEFYFCSKHCMDKYLNRVPRLEDIPSKAYCNDKNARTVVTMCSERKPHKHCLNCGKSISTEPCLNCNTSQDFCSENCSNEFQEWKKKKNWNAELFKGIHD